MKARLPKGMGGGPQNMNQIIKQAQKMQDDMKALQEELDATEYEGMSGSGVVKATVSGKHDVVLFGEGHNQQGAVFQEIRVFLDAGGSLIYIRLRPGAWILWKPGQLSFIEKDKAQADFFAFFSHFCLLLLPLADFFPPAVVLFPFAPSGAFWGFSCFFCGFCAK